MRVFLAGGIPVEIAKDLRGASNTKAKGQPGWSPAQTSWREGFFRRQPGAQVI